MTTNNRLRELFCVNVSLCLIPILIFIYPVYSLNKNNLYSNIAFIDEGVMIPIYCGFISIPIHPGFVVGCEYRFKNSKNLHLLQTLNAGGYYHPHFEHGIFGYSEFGIRPIFNFGLAPEILLGLGYLHTFEDDPVFSQNSSGEYVQMRNYGRSHLMGTFSLGLGYDLLKKTKLPIIPYIRYQAAIEYPYTLNNGQIPVLMHTIFYLGTIFEMHSIFNLKGTTVN
jgi:hypothetical protein